MLDESLAGLIWGYEALTGEKLDIYDTLRKLDKDGLEIRIHSAAPNEDYWIPNDGPIRIRAYSFPTNL